MTSMNKTKYSFLGLILASSALLAAQEANPAAQNNGPQDQPNVLPAGPQGTYDNAPLYKIQVVARDIPAINYFHRNGSTKIGFQGTALLPDAKGSAKVDSRLGRTSIEASFEGLSPANGF